MEEDLQSARCGAIQLGTIAEKTLGLKIPTANNLTIGCRASSDMATEFQSPSPKWATQSQPDLHDALRVSKCTENCVLSPVELLAIMGDIPPGDALQNKS